MAHCNYPQFLVVYCTSIKPEEMKTKRKESKGQQQKGLLASEDLIHFADPSTAVLCSGPKQGS